jgi:hypothetical protein
MQRAIIVLWVLLALSCPCGAAEDSGMAPPVYRYLMVVETSAKMERLKQVTLDTVHELILTGMYGRIQRGEVLGIWPFKTDVDRKLSRPIHWSARERVDLANFIFRKLRDVSCSKESSLEAAMAAVMAEARRSERLTVFLITSGAEPFRGTEFDQEINAVFQQHVDAMSAARRPFVSVLVFEGGEVVAHAVTPGGRPIYIPLTPDAEPVAEPVAEPEKPEPEAIVPVAVPKPLTVEEIEAKVREAEVERAAERAVEVEAEIVPAVEPVAEPEKVESEAAVVPAAVPKPLTVEEIEAKLREAEAERAAERAVEFEAEAVPAVEPVAEPEKVEPEAPEPPAAVEPATVEGILAQIREAEVERLAESAVEAEAVTVLDAELAPERGPEPIAREETGVPAQETPWKESRRGPVFYLAAGVGLMVLAMVVIWWRYHRPRRRFHASVISQSMNQK